MSHEAPLPDEEKDILRAVIDASTVATYRSRLMAKLGGSDVPGLVRLAIRTRLIEADGTY